MASGNNTWRTLKSTFRLPLVALAALGTLLAGFCFCPYAGRARSSTSVLAVQNNQSRAIAVNLFDDISRVDVGRHLIGESRAILLSFNNNGPRSVAVNQLTGVCTRIRFTPDSFRLQPWERALVTASLSLLPPNATLPITEERSFSTSFSAMVTSDKPVGRQWNLEGVVCSPIRVASRQVVFPVGSLICDSGQVYAAPDFAWPSLSIAIRRSVRALRCTTCGVFDAKLLSTGEVATNGSIEFVGCRSPVLRPTEDRVIIEGIDDSGNSFGIAVEVHARLVGDIELQPRVVVVRGPEDGHKPILVTSRMRRPIAVDEIEMEGRSLDARVRSLSPWSYEIQAPPEIAARARQKQKDVTASITIRYLNVDQAPVSVPVRYCAL